MKWEKFDHTHLYDEGEYVVEIDGWRREVLTNDINHDKEQWWNYWCDSNGDSHDQNYFTRIFRLDLDDAPSPVEQANKFLDARFDTIN